MRLFAGVPLTGAPAEAAPALLRALRSRVTAVAPDARLTWVGPERLHLTVRFIGEVDARQASRIADAFEPPLAIAPFDVTFDGLGAFPARGPLRVIWLGLAAGQSGLAAVERLVSDRLAAAGVPRDPTPFRPHLTLARVRQPGRLRLDQLTDASAALPTTVPGAMTVDAITLYESRLLPGGPVYVPLRQARLRVS